MKNIFAWIVVAIIVLVGGFFAFNNYIYQEKQESGHEVMGGSMSHDEMHESMHISSDEEFILGMIPHHQEAIDTAHEVLERGGDIKEVRDLAENIIRTQEKEIVEMKQWYFDWFGKEYVDNGTYMHMMRELDTLSNKELDLVFVEDMIIHHEGALVMAEQALDFSARPELLSLSQNILKTQQEEIELMEKILKDYAI